MSLTKKVIYGGSWIFALRISRRALDFLRTVILAKFLAPHDFGLMGIAILALQTIEAFSQTGFQAALVQKKDDIKSHMDVAWTAFVLRGVGLFGVLLLSGPFIAKFFKTPESSVLIQALGISCLIQGFINVGVVSFQREMDFKKQYIYESSGLIFEFLLSVVMVLILKNVWALVIGKICGDVARLIASYIISRYQPKFDFSMNKFRELQEFGRWITGVNVLSYVITQGDSILVGKLFGPAALGMYKLGSTIANLPTTEITHVISQVTFPAYSKVQHDLNKLKRGFLKTLYMTGFVSAVLTILIFVFIDLLTKTFLGEKWLGIVPITKILVIAGFIRSLAAIPAPLFQAIGNAKMDTISQIVRLSAFLVTLYPLIKMFGLYGVAFSVLISICCTLIFWLFQVPKLFIHSVLSNCA